MVDSLTVSVLVLLELRGCSMKLRIMLMFDKWGWNISSLLGIQTTNWVSKSPNHPYIRSRFSNCGSVQYCLIWGCSKKLRILLLFDKWGWNISPLLGIQTTNWVSKSPNHPYIRSRFSYCGPFQYCLIWGCSKKLRKMLMFDKWWWNISSLLGMTNWVRTPVAWYVLLKFW